MGHNHVYSTLSTDVKYTRWSKGGGDLPHVEKEVLIKGGTNVFQSDRVQTPMGVYTPVTDEELQLMENDPVFRMHRDKGFVRVETRKVDAEVAAARMTTRDSSAPLTESDFSDKDNLPKPVIPSVH